MDAIPNSEFNRICPKCSHHNLKWRVFCVLCGSKLDHQHLPEVIGDRVICCDCKQDLGHSSKWFIWI